MPARKKTFATCGHKGFGEYCHRCAQGKSLLFMATVIRDDYVDKKSHEPFVFQSWFNLNARGCLKPNGDFEIGLHNDGANIPKELWECTIPKTAISLLFLEALRLRHHRNDRSELYDSSGELIDTTHTADSRMLARFMLNVDDRLFH